MTFEHSTRRAGITLIEVIVGIAMLGTILTILVSSIGKFDKIAASASEKSKAVTELDSLISTFFREGFPKDSESHVYKAEPTWLWQIERRPWRESPEQFDLSVVRLFKLDSENHRHVLASVELLLRK